MLFCVDSKGVTGGRLWSTVWYLSNDKTTYYLTINILIFRVLATFAIGVYGSLVYGVFREKRIFTMPFLVFQVF